MSTVTDDPDRLTADELLALALARPKQALAAARAILAGDPGPARAAVAHQAAGVVLRDFGDVTQALTELRAAVRCARAAGDGDREADVLASLGVALVMAGQTRRGQATLDRAVQAGTGVLAGRILIRRAWVFDSLGRRAEALADARRAVDLLAGAGDLVWEARAYHFRALAGLSVGDTEQADRDYATCADLYLRTGQQLEYASARQERGATAFARGDLPAALAHLDAAEEVVQKLGVFEAELHVTQVTVLLAAGLHREALTAATDALRRIRAERGSLTRRAELLHCAALAAYAVRNFELAQGHAREALRLFRRQGRHWWTARTELVLLQARHEAAPRTPDLLRRAERSCALLDDLDPEYAVDAHLLAARIALVRGRRELGHAHLRAAAAMPHQGLQARVGSWLARATLAADEGRSRAMLAACDRGLNDLDVYLRTLGATELRVLASAQGIELAAMALRNALQRGDARQVLRWSERWRATALAVPPVRPAVPDVVPAVADVVPAVADAAQDGADATQDGAGLDADLAALRGLGRRIEAGHDRAGVLDTLNRERHRLESSVRRRALRTPGTPGAIPPPLHTDDVLDALGDATLVELVDVDGTLVAVVARDHRVRLRRIGPTEEAAKSLAHALFVLRREGSRRGDYRLDLDPVGARLQADLLGPVAGLLDGDGPVVVVPTGRLHAVPWGMLPVLRERPTTVMPSAAAWLRSRQAVPPSERRVVLVGGPGLSAGAEEIRGLARQYPRAQVLAEGSATAENVLAAMDGAWLVHIAAHGTFRADSPLFSALELDDGALTVYDLERLPRPPHRVVLSSCSSAVGAPTGADELLGVVTSLLALGSAGIVASVVPVNDRATTPLMLALHRRLLQGHPLATALALARGEQTRDDRLTQSVAAAFIALGS